MAATMKAEARTGTRTRPKARRRRPLLAGWGLIGWAAILAAALFLGWTAWTLFAGDHARDRATGPERERDLVLRSSSREIAALNTMDRADPSAGLKAWLDASTGPLHDQLQRDQPANQVKIGKSRTSASAAVTGAAVTSLDTGAGKAEVIASVRVTLTPQGGAPTLQRKRFEAGVVRTASGWKLESLTAVPVGAR
jgi:Mce-associated membrane protein